MGDIRDSGAVEEDADIIIFPHRESYYQAKEANADEADVVPAELIIDKNRNGATGIATCYFEKTCARFINSAPIEVREMSYQKKEFLG